jgi:hypothetical protein
MEANSLCMRGLKISPGTSSLEDELEEAIGCCDRPVCSRDGDVSYSIKHIASSDRRMRHLRRILRGSVRKLNSSAKTVLNLDTA